MMMHQTMLYFNEDQLVIELNEEDLFVDFRLSNIKNVSISDQTISLESNFIYDRSTIQASGALEIGLKYDGLTWHLVDLIQYNCEIGQGSRGLSFKLADYHAYKSDRSPNVEWYHDQLNYWASRSYEEITAYIPGDVILTSVNTATMPVGFEIETHAYKMTQWSYFYYTINDNNQWELDTVEYNRDASVEYIEPPIGAYEGFIYNACDDVYSMSLEITENPNYDYLLDGHVIIFDDDRVYVDRITSVYYDLEDDGYILEDPDLIEHDLAYGLYDFIFIKDVDGGLSGKENRAMFSSNHCYLDLDPLQ